MKFGFIVLISLVAGCGTSVIRPISPPESVSPEKAYVLFQYIYEDKDGDRTDHALVFGTSESKSIKVRVDASADTDSGIVFEAPARTDVQLFEFWDDTSEPFRINKFAEPIATVQGKVVHAGFMHFVVDRNHWEYWALDETESKEMLDKAHKKYKWLKKYLSGSR